MQSPDGEDAHSSSGTMVFLVHGTWGGRSDWHTPDGPLATALTAVGCQVRQFRWDGANTLRSRMHAAGELAVEISTAEAAGWRVVVVSHSHGGNVARMASHQAGPGRDDRTLVCFGAPFLVVEHNRGWISSKPWLTLQFVLGMRGVRQLTRERLVSPVWERLATYWLRSLSVFAAMDALLYLLSYRTRQETARSLAAKIDPLDTFATVKVVVVPADEAALALGAGQLVGLLAGRATAVIDAAADHIRRRRTPIAVGAAAFLAASPVLRRHRLAGQIYFNGFCAFVMAVAYSFLPTLLLGWVEKIVGGWDGAALSGRAERWFSNDIARVTTAAAPRGHHQISVVDAGTDQSDRGPFSHSNLMTRPTVIAEVIEVL